jgi:hypothetical protein
VRFGPVAFWIAVGTVVIMAGWSVTSATYLAFRDDVLRTLIARQAQQQFGYEDRIAELRTQIDRTTSRQLLDQEQFEQKLDELVRRQATLESRATALGNFADPATTGSIGGAALRGRDPAVVPSRNDRGRQSSIGTTLDRMEASLDRIDRRQSLALGAMDDRRTPNPRRARPARDKSRRREYRRPVRARQAAAQHRRICAGGVSRQSGALRARPAQRRASRRAGAPAGGRRDRRNLAVRRARGSIRA